MLGFDFDTGKFVTTDGKQFHSLFEALKHELGFDEICLKEKEKGDYIRITSKLRYSIRMDTFEKLVVSAFYDPKEFKILLENPELDEKQREFLDKVIKFALEILTLNELSGDNSMFIPINQI